MSGLFHAALGLELGRPGAGTIGVGLAWPPPGHGCGVLDVGLEPAVAPRSAAALSSAHRFILPKGANRAGCNPREGATHAPLAPDRTGAAPQPPRASQAFNARPLTVAAGSDRPPPAARSPPLVDPGPYVPAPPLPWSLSLRPGFACSCWTTGSSLRYRDVSSRCRITLRARPLLVMTPSRLGSRKALGR
jgi:hypothetical protein